MSNRTYPYKAWVLQPSFKPVEVELVEQYASWGSNDYGDKTATGKSYACEAMHPTKEAAIASGHAQLDKQMAVLETRTATLIKRRNTLTKAAT